MTMLTLVEMHPKSLHVTGMFLACNMQGFGTFAMHVCMLCACNMHTTCRDFECFQCMLHVNMHITLYSQYCDMRVSLNMHGSCMQHAHYMQEISTRVSTHCIGGT